MLHRWGEIWYGVCKNGTDLHCHHAKFYGARTSHADGSRKSLTFFVCFYQQHCAQRSAGILDDFEVSRLAGATQCIDGGEIWRGGANQASVPKFTRSCARLGA